MCNQYSNSDCYFSCFFTDINILEDSYQLVKHFLDFPLWEYRIASFNHKLFPKGSNSVLPESQTREMFYLLVGILKSISISVEYVSHQ